MSGTGPASLTVRSRHLRQRAPSPTALQLATHGAGRTALMARAPMRAMYIAQRTSLNSLTCSREGFH